MLTCKALGRNGALYIGMTSHLVRRRRLCAPTARVEGFMLTPEGQHLTICADHEGSARPYRARRLRRAPTVKTEDFIMLTPEDQHLTDCGVTNHS